MQQHYLCFVCSFARMLCYSFRQYMSSTVIPRHFLDTIALLLVRLSTQHRTNRNGIPTMLLSHRHEYPSFYENVVFVKKERRMDRKNNENLKPYESLRISYKSLRECLRIAADHCECIRIRYNNLLRFSYECCEWPCECCKCLRTPYE